MWLLAINQREVEIGMSNSEEFEDVKLLKKEEVSKLNLPEELIAYLTESHSYEEKLYEPILKDVEELFLYYSSFYEFSYAEFSKTALVALDRANSIDKFYFYLKKIIDKSIELNPKVDENTIFQISQAKMMEITEGIKRRYINIVDKMYEGQVVDLYEVGRCFAELELVLNIRHDDFSSDLLKYGKKVLESYLQELEEQEEMMEDLQTHSMETE